MRDLEKTLKALANRRRLGILSHLRKKGADSVGNIADRINASLKATSKHLGILLGADIVEGDQKGPEMHYRLAAAQKPVVSRVINLL